MSRKELAREHRTSLGRIVYDRKRHFFDDRDLFRITRAMLQRAGDDRTGDQPDINIGAYLGAILLTLIRGLFEWFDAITDIQAILVGFLWNFIPGILKIALRFPAIYQKLLKALWIWIGNALADANPSKPAI